MSNYFRSCCSTCCNKNIKFNSVCCEEKKIADVNLVVENNNNPCSCLFKWGACLIKVRYNSVTPVLPANELPQKN